MKLYLSSLLFLISLSAHSQFGLSVKYGNNDFNTWNSISEELFTETEEMHPQVLELGLDYWFKLKNHRIEFFPEFVVSGYKGVNLLNNSFTNENFNYRLLQYGINFNTHIYFLDLEGDCDCPTWSKQGTFFDKGLFIMLSPGLMFMNHSAILTDMSDIETNSLKANSTAFKIGVGLGVDIGINDLITVTPFVMYNYFPSVSSQFFDDTLARNCPSCDFAALESGSLAQLQFGLRMGFRPDYK